MTQKLLMGNEALAHAALEAGVRVAAGYPGTPSSEVIETIAALQEEMMQAAEALEFERAAYIRDQIKALQKNGR